jgi:hypothetical protein
MAMAARLLPNKTKGIILTYLSREPKRGFQTAKEGIKGSTSAADDAGRDRKLKSDGRLAQDKLKLMRKI